MHLRFKKLELFNDFQSSSTNPAFIVRLSTATVVAGSHCKNGSDSAPAPQFSSITAYLHNPWLSNGKNIWRRLLLQGSIDHQILFWWDNCLSPGSKGSMLAYFSWNFPDLYTFDRLSLLRNLKIVVPTLQSDEPAAINTLLECQSMAVTVDLLGFLICLETHHSFSFSK